MIDAVLPLPDGLGGDAAVTVLWRPGCPYCALLLRRLERTGLEFTRVNIWAEPAAAAWVRSVADGNETVPTVRIRGTLPEHAVALVNPSATVVLDTVGRINPGAAPEQATAAGTPVARWFRALRGRVRGRAGSR